MRVRGPFLDGWHSALNELVLRDGEAVRQMEREDSSVEQGAASALLYSVCSVISSAKGGGCVRHSAAGRGAVLFPGPARGSAADPLCRRFILPDGGLRQDGARYSCALSDKLALATGVAAWGPRWRVGVLPTASAVPSLRLWGRRCNLSSYGRPVLLVGAKGGRKWPASAPPPNPDRGGRGSWLPGGGGMAGRKKRAV